MVLLTGIDLKNHHLLTVFCLVFFFLLFFVKWSGVLVRLMVAFDSEFARYMDVSRVG